MIDLHCHILPGIDDGSPDIETSLAMARMAAADGIEVVACTPHIMPGVYDNSGDAIRAAIARLAEQIRETGIPLRLVSGADVHLSPGLLPLLRDGRIPTIGGSRYFLFEPPHHVVPPRLHDFAFNLLASGYIPVLTHPERLYWIDGQYELIRQLFETGVLMQLTAGSITGRFGRRAKYWSDRMLEEGLVDLVASDGHDVKARPPRLAEARDAIAADFGDEEALRLVAANPQRILDNGAVVRTGGKG